MERTRETTAEACAPGNAFIVAAKGQSSLLTSTFCHIRGIGTHREQALWASGVLTWDDFEKLHQPQLSLFSGSNRNSATLRELETSRTALERKQLEYFARTLPKREHYRLACAFPEDTVFLDIETTGLSRYYDHITLVGLSRGDSYHVYLKGQDPKPLIDAINSAQIVVTFNGSLFDLPFLAQEFEALRPPTVHIDLRFLARRVGLKGGQKELEAKLSVARSVEVSNMRGDSAPVLWHRFRRGDESALRTLILYNHADVQGMKEIFDVVARRLVKKLHASLAKAHQPIFSTARLAVDADGEVERLRAAFGNQFPRVRAAATIDDLGQPRLSVVGIDLTGSEQRPTGWCLLEGRQAETCLIASDSDLIERTLSAKPDLVSIDSPLSLPRGFRLGARGGIVGKGDIMRFCERLLKKRGVNAYPALIPSMRKLTARGIRLASVFRSHGIPTIESYPGAAQDVMNIPRKRASLELLEAGLGEFGVQGSFFGQSVSHDELDAITSALVGVFFWSGRFERLGVDDFGDEALIIPDLRTVPTQWKSRIVIGISGPLAAGKTTAAYTLQTLGLHYARYSMVVEDCVRRSGREPTRSVLQQEGEQLHARMGQRWLGAQLLRRLPKGGNYVIDGLRFPEDHAYLSETFGPAFIHAHVTAPSEQRKQRFKERGNSDVTFDHADAHNVESRSLELKALASVVIANTGTLNRFVTSVQGLVEGVAGSSCQSQS